MDNKKILKKLIEAFAFASETGIEDTVKEVFEDVKAEDGRIIRVDSIEVNSVAQEVTEDGLIDIEDSTITLEDGRKLVIEAGIIKDIMVEVEQEPTEEMESETEVIEESNENEDGETSELIEKIKTLLSEFKAIKKDNEEMKIKLQKLSDEPSAIPTQTEVKLSTNNKYKSPLHAMLANKKK